MSQYSEVPKDHNYLRRNCPKENWHGDNCPGCNCGTYEAPASGGNVIWIYNIILQRWFCFIF